MKLHVILMVMLSILTFTTQAEARRSNYSEERVSSRGVGPKPDKWCGWFMRTMFGGGPEYNRAIEWKNRGRKSNGPQVGAIVVWPHHVGVITGKTKNGWVVKSGNDSNRVRERVRSVENAVAFRIL